MVSEEDIKHILHYRPASSYEENFLTVPVIYSGAVAFSGCSARCVFTWQAVLMKSEPMAEENKEDQLVAG